MRAIIVSILALAALAACGRSGGSGPAFGTTSIGPAEMELVTANPLLTPPTLDLPPPTPGQTNRANPRQRMTVAQ